ncbi:hypothetical protein LR48_Vigan02g067900 [Vigna angularis]|uniref:DUF8039 domain-containing protein n=1 Tax=Phaseolus angularis TaxID=3914 RepID=A0A0L9TWI6_PHAAN|nr:hypothetical protein LR48_Vigan02g067900 [Vigna angularis]
MKQDIRKEITQEITKKVRAELYDEVVEMVTSDKESCSVANALGDDMDDTRPCQIYVFSPTGTMLVARGIVYEEVIVVHGVELGEYEVKVSVDKVVVADAIVLVPTKDFFTVAQAFKCFAAWPRQLIGAVSDPSINTPTIYF